MSTKNLPPDVLREMRNEDVFISIAFVSPKSPQWPQVKQLLQNADRFLEKDNIFCGLFKKTASSIRIAHRILNISFKWKTCHLFIEGVPSVSLKPVKWLECFILSLRVHNLRAHCNCNGWLYGVWDNPHGERKERRALLPCRLLKPYGWYTDSLGCSVEEQLQAHAVRTGVDQCPNYGKFPVIVEPQKEELTSGLDFMRKSGFYYGPAHTPRPDHNDYIDYDEDE